MNFATLSEQLTAMGPVGIVIALVLGVAIGVAIGLTGVGGGVLVVPGLTIFLGFDYAVSVATAVIYSVIIKIYAVFEHWRLRHIDFKHSLLFLAGALPGGIGSSMIVKKFGTNPEFKAALGWVVLGTIIMSGVLMIFDFIRKKKKARALAAGGEIAEPVIGTGRKVLGVVLGFLVGILMGSTGVGGGVMVIPVLVLCLGMSMRMTVGSSIFIAVSMMMASALVFMFLPTAGKGGGVQPHIVAAVAMGVGSFGGVFIGSRLSKRLSNNMLQALVILMIVLATTLMVLKMAGVIGGTSAAPGPLGAAGSSTLAATRGSSTLAAMPGSATAAAMVADPAAE